MAAWAWHSSCICDIQRWNSARISSNCRLSSSISSRVSVRLATSCLALSQCCAKAGVEAGAAAGADDADDVTTCSTDGGEEPDSSWSGLLPTDEEDEALSPPCDSVSVRCSSFSSLPPVSPATVNVNCKPAALIYGCKIIINQIMC